MRKTFPRSCRDGTLTPLCHCMKPNARIGRMSLDEPEDDEAADA